MSSPFTPPEATVLRGSFDRVARRADALAETFYRLLFERAPSVRPLFEESMDEQYYKFVRMVGLMVEMAEHPARFEAECRASGERHRMYGALPAHYPVVGETLIAALRETSTPPLTPAEEALWLRLYTWAAGIMVGAP